MNSDISFSQNYVDEIVCRVSQAIIPEVRRLAKSCYGFGKVEYEYNPEEGIYVWKIPTVLDGGAFKYYYLIFAFLPEIDRELYFEKCESAFKYVDLRRCDSASIFVVSPRIRATHYYRLKHFGPKAYLRWRDLVHGCEIRVRAFPIVARTVEKCLHRIYKFTWNFINKRLNAIAEKVGITDYDKSELKLISLITNGVYKLNRGVVGEIILYFAKLSIYLKSLTCKIVSNVKLKARILDELELLGIPARKHYNKFSKIVDEIIRLNEMFRGPEPIIKLLNSIGKVKVQVECRFKR